MSFAMRTQSRWFMLDESSRGTYSFTLNPYICKKGKTKCTKDGHGRKTCGREEMLITTSMGLPCNYGVQDNWLNSIGTVYYMVGVVGMSAKVGGGRGEGAGERGRGEIGSGR